LDIVGVIEPATEPPAFDRCSSKPEQLRSSTEAPQRKIFRLFDGTERRQSQFSGGAHEFFAGEQWIGIVYLFPAPASPQSEMLSRHGSKT
jgi:hypothetical protein